MCTNLKNRAEKIIKDKWWSYEIVENYFTRNWNSPLPELRDIVWKDVEIILSRNSDNTFDYVLVYQNN